VSSQTSAAPGCRSCPGRGILSGRSARIGWLDEALAYVKSNEGDFDGAVPGLNDDESLETNDSCLLAHAGSGDERRAPMQSVTFHEPAQPVYFSLAWHVHAPSNSSQLLISAPEQSRLLHPI
jgi:hypothetical protein